MLIMLFDLTFQTLNECVLGKLLREAEPELMDTLIQATKVGDQKTLQALAGSKTQILEEKEEEEDDEDDQFEYSVIKFEYNEVKLITCSIVLLVELFTCRGHRSLSTLQIDGLMG